MWDAEKSRISSSLLYLGTIFLNIDTKGGSSHPFSRPIFSLSCRQQQLPAPPSLIISRHYINCSNNPEAHLRHLPIPLRGFRSPLFRSTGVPVLRVPFPFFLGDSAITEDTRLRFILYEMIIQSLFNRAAFLIFFLLTHFSRNFLAPNTLSSDFVYIMALAVTGEKTWILEEEQAQFKRIVRFWLRTLQGQIGYKHNCTVVGSSGGGA
jgi:hypothetical protein